MSKDEILSICTEIKATNNKMITEIKYFSDVLSVWSITVAESTWAWVL